MSAFDALLELLRAELRAVVREELKALQTLAEDPWVDSETSGLGPHTFRRLIKTGQIVASRQGRKLVTRRSEIDRYLATQQVKRCPAPAAEAEHDPIQQLVDAGRLRVIKRGA